MKRIMFSCAVAIFFYESAHADLLATFSPDPVVLTSAGDMQTVSLTLTNTMPTSALFLNVDFTLGVSPSGGVDIAAAFGQRKGSVFNNPLVQLERLLAAPAVPALGGLTIDIYGLMGYVRGRLFP